MMKKIFSAMMAFAILFATSCQNDLDTAATTGDVAEVTFSLTTEDATRAYGDGATATVLKYAVYDADGVILPQQTKEDATINGSTTVRFTLTSGKNYSFIFWAGAADAPYTVDLANKTMTVNYTGATSNAENRDAFYAYKEVNVAGNSTFTVELKRPFAQLNIGTNDYAASEAAGYAPTQTAVKVKSIYKTLNLATGVASEEAEITFDYAAIPDGETFPVTGDYKYLAMNYLLVGQNAGDKQVVDIVFSHKEDTGDETSRTVGSVPVQRNYRTNIYGKLLTNDLDINIEIKPGFDGNEEVEALYLAAAFGGEITLTEDVELTTPLDVQANTSINLGGNKLSGNVNLAEGVALKIENGTIENTDDAVSGITTNGDLTLDNVEIASARHALRIESGTVVINGGVYKVAPTSNKTLHALNVGDNGTVANVIINGGTFIGPKGTMADSGSALSVKAGSTVTINGGDFSGGKNKTLSSNGTLVVKGGTFDQSPAAFLADGYKAVEIDGNYQVVSNDNVYNAAELAAALTADVEEINVVLFDDIDLPISTLGQQTGGSGEYKLGGENTKKITIDLNGKKLNITTTYWSAIGAKNDNALFTIKNGTMTSTGNSAGTWNAWDLRFSNCDYVIEDVVFEKAVALDNVGKSTSMKNVTITDTHNTDTYGLWITAEGQTVTLEDCVIDMLPASDGRGIKIDEQYVGTPAKVTLNVTNVTFKTEEKAAILVKSAAGADINVSNLNIAEVAADNMFAVWVDSDAAAHADKVVVTGAKKAVEGTVVTPADQAGLNAAIKEGATIVLSAGTYNMPSTGGKNITIIGDKNVTINAGAANMGSGNVTLDGVTITAGSYKGFQHSGVVTYNNVTIKGQLNCYGAKDIFNNCTFELDNAYVWTYGSDYTEFNGCTFNTNGKAILIYNEGAGPCDVKVIGCTFNATAGAMAGAIANQNCAAIEIDNFRKMQHKLTTSGNTVDSDFSGEWRIKSYVAGAPVTVNGTEYTSIAIDGKLMTIDAGKNVTVQD